MFQWTTYNFKPETVPPVNRVPIGESQYYRAVTGNKFSSAGLSSQPEFLGPPVTNKRNFLGNCYGDQDGHVTCVGVDPPSPPVFTGDTPPYLPPTYDPGSYRYPHRVRGDKRSPYDLRDFILPRKQPLPPIMPGGRPGPVPIDPGGGVPVDPTDPGTVTTPADTSAGGSLSSLFSGIPTTYLLIGGAAALYFLMKKK